MSEAAGEATVTGEHRGEIGHHGADRRFEPIAEGVADLLGVLAYGELSAFDRMAEDARQAPTIGG
ncbi:MAG: ferritin-like fold-containing protein, partial [Sciscionella sp.]